MATINVKFRVPSARRSEGTLVYQVTHNRVTRQINSGYKLSAAEWNPADGTIVIPAGAEKSRRACLLSLRSAVAKDVARLRGIVSRLEDSGCGYTSDSVVELYRSATDGFVAFARELNGQLCRIGRERTAETYACAVNSFERFLGPEDVALEEVDSNLMVAYETYLRSTGVCANTSSFYMRNLRAIYNRAVENELTLQRNPFRHVYTGVDKTVKRAVPLSVIRAIRDADLSDNPLADYARDVFMFSFYTRGMSFVDMAYLKKKDLQNGILSYRRRKTNQQLFIKWEKPMQAIVDKYDTAGTPYLLPLIRRADKDARRQYLSAAHLVNNKLRALGWRLGLAMPLTSYVARHAWASIAKSKNISVSVISEAMGHDSEVTTRIYLSSLDTTQVDRANSLILRAL